MKQDKWGIMLPDSTKIPLAHERDDNLTRIYTTKNEQPMTYSEVKQCLEMYQKEFGIKAKTIILPKNLEDKVKEIKKEFGLEVKLGAARYYQITLSAI